MPRDQDPPQIGVNGGERSAGSASWRVDAQELLRLFSALPTHEQDQALRRLRRRVQRQAGLVADAAAAERDLPVSPLWLLRGDLAKDEEDEGEDAEEEVQVWEPASLETIPLAPLRQTPQLERMARLGALIQRGQQGRRQEPVQAPPTARHAQDVRDEHDTAVDLARDDHQEPVERHEELAAEERHTSADTAQATLYEDWSQVKQRVEAVVHQQQQAEQRWERLASALPPSPTVMSPLPPLSLDALQTLGRQGWELRQQEVALWREVAEVAEVAELMAAQDRLGAREPDGEQEGGPSAAATAGYAEGAGSAPNVARVNARSTPNRSGHAPASGEASGEASEAVWRDLLAPQRPLSLPAALEARRAHLERARQDQQLTRQRLAPEDRWYVIMWEEAGVAYGGSPVSHGMDSEMRGTMRSAQASAPPASANVPQPSQQAPSVMRAPQIVTLYDYPAP